MFRRDYRTILRRFEYDRLLTPAAGAVDRDQFGGRYSDRLLDEFFATDARKLPRLLGRLNETQRTLYVVNALCGQISNGGISQFFFNAPPVLRDAVPVALGRLGATEILRRYAGLVARLEGNNRLAAIRSTAQGWDDYRDFKAELGDDPASEPSFDDWYFDGQASTLDRLMRMFIAGREDDLVRFCDGHPGLEARWTRQRLGRLIADHDGCRTTRYPFFDLLFTPECRTRFGVAGDERREAARLVAESLVPFIRTGIRHPRRVIFEGSPTPRLVVGQPGTGFVAIEVHEDECNLYWSIASWG